MLELRAEPADGAPSRALWDEYMADVRSRLGAAFQPKEEIFASPEAFTGPGTAWLVGYEDGRAVCCGGLRPLPSAGADVCELKRMFVSRAARGRGHGRALLRALERLAIERGFRHVRLFTTEVLVEARALYDVSGYVLAGTIRDGERTDLWLEKTLPRAP
jgi:GNAT superfamily N-acetyltransferase